MARANPRRQRLSEDAATERRSELLELLTMLILVGDTVANCAVTAGAAGTCWSTLLAGGSTVAMPEVSVLLELFNECPAEFGAEYPVA